MTMNTELALTELDACRGILLRATEADWSRPTPCLGWDVEALARHLAAVAWQQAEAFHRGRVGIGEAPSWLQAGGARATIVDLLSAARHHLAAGMASVVEGPEMLVPLPFAVLPASIAVDALVLEYGVHRHDLERSLGRAGDVDLDNGVTRVLAGLLPALVPLLAEKPAAAPITYRLTGDTTSVAITWEGDGWQGREGDGPVCEIGGSDAAIALLALGRLDTGHPALTISGERGAAAALATHIRSL